MKAYDLDNAVEWTFSHNNMVVAFGYIYADRNNLLTQWSTNPAIVIDKVKDQIITGKHGWHYGSIYIPFDTLIDGEYKNEN